MWVGELGDHVHGRCEISDASSLIHDIRRLKSQEKLRFLRRAGEVLGQASATTIDLVKPGAFEGDLVAAFQQTVFL